jgi:hypothetical protein
LRATRTTVPDETLAGDDGIELPDAEAEPALIVTCCSKADGRLAMIGAVT